MSATRPRNRLDELPTGGRHVRPLTGLAFRPESHYARVRQTWVRRTVTLPELLRAGRAEQEGAGR